MEKLIVLAVVIAVVLAVVAVAFAKKPAKGEAPKKRRLLTEREQAMHNRLTQALPNAVILAQVSMGALLTARSRATRNRFDRKIVDFVVCDRAFQVLAVIELDDKSHQGKETQDAERDAMLERAGYRVIRYANVPDVTQVQKDFAQGTASPAR